MNKSALYLANRIPELQKGIMRKAGHIITFVIEN